MPRPTDESDASTLPDPELNPLLNPLLAAHMGRWAEVYFTSPPEKRGQAIAELLRELEKISPPDQASGQGIHHAREKEKTEMAKVLDSSPSAGETFRTCSACAHNNSAGQRFCGMCGAPLPVSPEAVMPEANLQAAESAPGSAVNCSESEPSLRANSIEYAIEPAISAPAASERQDSGKRMWPLPERNFPDLDVQAAPVSYRYRIFAGVALAILLVIVVYMARRGTKTFSSAPQSAAERAMPSALPPAPHAPAASSQALRAARSDSYADNPSVSLGRNKTQPEAMSPTMSPKNQAADAQSASQPVTVAASSSARAAEQSGAQEFATAEKYLNGTQSMTRDSREAALWLWKAVGKGNLAATMALSDLYLRGDGVTKSCEQARLLLDAAARKGEKAAADRLHDLPAFGCQ